MNVTAIVLTRRPYTREWPGLTVLAHPTTEFQTSADHQAAWNEAVGRVNTEHFCFIDDDDDLPEDYLEVIQACVDANKSLAFTDELLRFPDGHFAMHKGKPYSQAAHLADPMLVHHLAVCRTADAHEALRRTPVGKFWPEMPFYWELAKGSTAYIPRTGYLWNVREEGLHTQPFIHIGQTRSLLWCHAHP